MKMSTVYPERVCLSMLDANMQMMADKDLKYKLPWSLCIAVIYVLCHSLILKHVFKLSVNVWPESVDKFWSCKRNREKQGIIFKYSMKNNIIIPN